MAKLPPPPLTGSESVDRWNRLLFRYVTEPVSVATSSDGLTSVQKADLTDGGDSSLHFHSADRNRANHTGTQPASTISDLAQAVQSITGIGDGDKGDISVTNAGATWTIDSNAITTAKIQDDAVTYDKLQDVTTHNRILGRSTSGAGNVEEIAPGAGVLTWLITPSSANLRAALTDETGTGAAVFADTPTITTPTLSGTTSSGAIAATVSTNSGYSVTNGTITGIYVPSGLGGMALYVTSNHQLDIGTNNTTRLVVTADGRFYGTALHNNAGSVTGTTTQHIASGTYTPTGTAVADIDTITPNVCQWLRDGNVVTVSGSGSAVVTAIAGTVRTFRLTLPIASTIAGTNKLAGTGAALISGATALLVMRVLPASANNEAFFQFMGASGATYAFSFTFTYEVA